jgi:hypothetical protein
MAEGWRRCAGSGPWPRRWRGRWWPVNVTTVGETVAAWAVAVQANNKALEVDVTGEAGQTIRWVAVVRTVEVAF